MAVFADALEAAGDPWGQLMQLQLALEARPDDARLVEAEKRHLALHGKKLLGALQTASSMLNLEWSRGHVLSVRLTSHLADATWGEPVAPQRRSKFPRLIRELSVLPVMSRLQKLEVTMQESSFSLVHLAEAVDEAVRLKLGSLLEVRVSRYRFEAET